MSKLLLRPRRVDSAANPRGFSRSRFRSCGFSLVELLVVIAIVMVLAGVGFGIFSAVGNRQSAALTQSQLSVIGAALEAYRNEFGSYPVTHSNVPGVVLEDVEPGILLFQALAGIRDPYGRPLDSRPANTVPDGQTRRRPFIDAFSSVEMVERMSGTYVPIDANANYFDPQDIDARFEFADGWGHNLEYKYVLNEKPGHPANTWKRFGFLLYSRGADNESSTPPGSGILPPIDERSDVDRDNIYLGE